MAGKSPIEWTEDTWSSAAASRAATAEDGAIGAPELERPWTSNSARQQDPSERFTRPRTASALSNGGVSPGWMATKSESASQKLRIASNRRLRGECGIM